MKKEYRTTKAPSVFSMGLFSSVIRKKPPGQVSMAGRDLSLFRGQIFHRPSNQVLRVHSKFIFNHFPRFYLVTRPEVVGNMVCPYYPE